MTIENTLDLVREHNKRMIALAQNIKNHGFGKGYRQALIEECQEFSNWLESQLKEMEYANN